MAQIKQKVKKLIEIRKKLPRASGSNVSKSTKVEMKHFWFGSALDELLAQKEPRTCTRKSIYKFHYCAQN